MSLYGLYQPYRVNRRLNQFEKNNVLNKNNPRKGNDINPGESVIRLNYTYLETVDKFYKISGVYSSMWLSGFIILSFGYLYIMFRAYFLSFDDGKDFIYMLVVSAIMIPFIFPAAYPLLKEWFKWTHYPIRFNRVNKMVYVFRTDGTVLSAPWKAVYFVRDREPGPLNEWTIRGHILDDDGEPFWKHSVSVSVREGVICLSTGSLSVVIWRRMLFLNFRS